MALCLRQRRALASLGALLLLIGAPALAGEVLVYAQNPNYQSLYASQNDTSTGGFGNFATTYDNFTLGATTAINQGQWVGGYFNPQSLRPITQWTVSFYANNGGQPGTLFQAFVIAGNGGETFLQNDVLGDPNYLYTAAVSLSAAAGTTYWLSVVPDLAFPPEWDGAVHRRGTAILIKISLGFARRSPTTWRSHCLRRQRLFRNRAA